MYPHVADKSTTYYLNLITLHLLLYVAGGDVAERIKIFIINVPINVFMFPDK